MPEPKPKPIKTGASSPLPKAHPIRAEMAANNPKPEPAPVRNTELKDLSKGSARPGKPVTVGTPAKRPIVGHVQGLYKDAGTGAKELGNRGGAILGVLAAAFLLIILARARGAQINLEKLVAGSFVVALGLMMLSGLSSKLALSLAVLILLTAVFEYGPLALGGIGTKTGKAADVPGITTPGQLVTAGAAGFGIYEGAKIGGNALSGFAKGAGEGAGLGLLSGLKSIFSKLGNVVTRVPVE